MNNKKIITVFISCPMDVDKEANIVYNKCIEYSELLMSSENKIMIKPFYWKKDIVSEIDVTRNTLSVIMEQKRLKFEGKNEDIYIGIMWKRYGDNDKLEKGYSPTEQEYRWALDKQEKTGSPFIQFYFKKSSIGFPSTNKELAEIAKVNTFCESIRIKNCGAFSPFKTKKEFEEKIIKTLIYYIDKKVYITYKKKVPKKKYEFNELKLYISRRVYDFKDENKFYLIEQEKYSEDLVNLTQKNNKIVLLGDAGTGKTFELKYIAQYFSGDEKPLYPVYKSLNLYVNENLDDYLPKEWKKYIENPQIDENHLLIILDGFDEVKNKSIAQRKILAFCEKHPNTHFLISCRSNFYKKEKNEEFGTLNNFHSYSLLGLTKNQIRGYLNNKLTLKKSDEFLSDILSKKLNYLLEIPFYLINLVSSYNENGTLPKSKAEIFKFLLEKRIKLDEQKYNTKIELDQEKSRILNTLEKLALGMELLCKNQITVEEYHQIIPDKELKDLIKHSTCWERLKFEHNNFQEFLAAKALSKLEFSQIKEIITFSPEHKKIIPSWSNTISFLFSILNKDNTLLKELKNWIVETQPNILLCAEPDKIEKQTRVEIFKSIFNSYKEKNLWINSQKYNTWDLVKFGESEEVIVFLMSELSKENSSTSRNEALSLIGYFDKLYRKEKEIKEKLLSMIFDDEEDHNIKYRSLLNLSRLKITNEKDIEKIILKFKNSDDDNYRYAIYRLINKNRLNDKYIDVFLDGIKFSRRIYHREEKPLNIGEILQLEEGLANSKEITSLEKIIRYFKDNPDDIDNAYIERSFEIIIRNTIEIYKSTNNSSIFCIMLDFTTSFKERHYYDDFYKKIITFFEKTETLFNAFTKVYKMTIDLRKKMILLSNLSNNETLEFIIEEYENKNITNDFIVSYQNYLISYNSKYYESFNNLLIKKYGDKFKLQPQPDYKKQKEERLKRDIRLLFDKKAFIDEIKLIFEIIGKLNLNEDDLFKFDTDNWENRYYSKIIYDTLLSFANEKMILVESVIKTFNDSNYWDCFKIGNIYTLMNNKEYIPTDEQKKWIENWCISNVEIVNFKTASWLSVYLVYFMKELNFSYNQDVMLDILSFVTSLKSIDFIEKYVSPNKISERILLNLKEGIAIEEVLVNHINYCINNKLDEVLNYVYNYLLLYKKDNFRIKELRNASLKAILSLANDYKNLKETLVKIQDDYKWIIVDKLINKNIEITYIEKYLLNLLKSKNEDISFEASEYLIKLQNIEGLQYYVEYVRKNKKFRYNDWKESPFSKLTNIELTPLLIELLEIDFNEKIEQDKYESLYKHVTNAIKSIALYSEKNYLAVKLSIESFIKNNKKIKKINRLYYFLEDLELQFYINKSEAIEIKEVVSKLKELNF